MLPLYKGLLEGLLLKINKVADRFKAAPIICPVCREKMQVSKTGMTCGKGHSYDFSTKGYINLSHSKGDIKYGKELFKARRQILSSGYYNKIVSRLDELIPPGSTVLDTGCGEGYFSTQLSKSRRMYAIDMAKAGIELCDKTADVRWIVGDLAAIPLEDNSMDAILNILSPANYSEFRRVLKAGGKVYKAVPGDCYLQELRQALGKDLHSAKDTVDAFKQHMKDVTEERITYTLQVKQEDKAALFKMTPLTFHEDIVIEVGSITIDIILLSGKV